MDAFMTITVASPIASEQPEIPVDREGGGGVNRLFADAANDFGQFGKTALKDSITTPYR
ncbi:hypothetical protein EW026_g1961 [Hermanssonia centrifuga]|uniref:Uncharacterized protein n=1 Tax=Hermanssonia centrifuga TaxID=98765 RepID=A0A4S4KPT6_9APHY|nr:hypothetical protein EW026_g1961 [Hermanssonia centrifuga]